MAEIKNKNKFPVLGIDFDPTDERWKDVKNVEDLEKLELFKDFGKRDQEWGNNQVLSFLMNRGAIEDTSGAPSTPFVAFPNAAGNDVATAQGEKGNSERLAKPKEPDTGI